MVLELPMPLQARVRPTLTQSKTHSAMGIIRPGSDSASSNTAIPLPMAPERVPQAAPPAPEPEPKAAPPTPEPVPKAAPAAPEPGPKAAPEPQPKAVPQAAVRRPKVAPLAPGVPPEAFVWCPFHNDHFCIACGRFAADTHLVRQSHLKKIEEEAHIDFPTYPKGMAWVTCGSTYDRNLDTAAPMAATAPAPQASTYQDDSPGTLTSLRSEMQLMRTIIQESQTEIEMLRRHMADRDAALNQKLGDQDAAIANRRKTITSWGSWS